MFILHSEENAGIAFVRSEASNYELSISGGKFNPVCSVSEVSQTTSCSLSFHSRIAEENEQASEREITCRVETGHACRAGLTRTSHLNAAGDICARSPVRFPRLPLNEKTDCS